MAVIPKTITDILQNVIFPGSNENVIGLEMVQEIRIAGSRISFTLVFQRDDDPNIQAVSEACANEIEKILGTEYDITITPKGIHRMKAPVLPGVKKYHCDCLRKRWSWEINCCCKPCRCIGKNRGKSWIDRC